MLKSEWPVIDSGGGPFKEYYDNGQVKLEGGVDHRNRWHGVFRDYTPDGTLSGEYVYEHSKRIGKKSNNNP